MGNELRNGSRRGRASAGKNGAPNTNRLASLKKARGQFDLSGLDTGRLLTSLGIAIERGGALRIGLTRDKGALAVGVYVDGASETVYLNAEDDQAQFWDTIDAVYLG